MDSTSDSNNSRARGDQKHAGLTILMAEDEPELRRLISLSLLQEGHKVLEAANGEEALRMATDYSLGIDLLLTDVQMPQMGGWELGSKLRSIHPETAILYMSGTTSPQPDLFMTAAFVQKPFQIEVLLTAIQQLLRKNSGGGASGELGV
jgi:two-component system cell cycle sensor histidine kinase/response regulator CckA